MESCGRAEEETGPQHMLLERFAALHMVHGTPKGRGVFASRDIPSGTIIDISPVLVLDPQENIEHIEKTSLYHYTYNWPTGSSTEKPSTTQAVVFGLGSMFNHSTQNQNVGWKRDLEREVVIYHSLRDIRRGEELCISYGDHLTFTDADRSVEQEPAEDEDQMLARIEIDE